MLANSLLQNPQMFVLIACRDVMLDRCVSPGSHEGSCCATCLPPDRVLSSAFFLPDQVPDDGRSTRDGKTCARARNPLFVRFEQGLEASCRRTRVMDIIYMGMLRQAARRRREHLDRALRYTTH